VPPNSDKFEAGKLTYGNLCSLRASLNFLQCAVLSELRMQQWLARVSHVREYLAGRHYAEPEDQRLHLELHVSGQVQDDSDNGVR